MYFWEFRHKRIPVNNQKGSAGFKKQPAIFIHACRDKLTAKREKSRTVIVLFHIRGQQLIPGSLNIKFCRMNSVSIIRALGVLNIELCQDVTTENILVMIDIYIEFGKLF